MAKKMDKHIYSAKLQRVVDGDTCDALIDLGFDTWVKKRIRFYGVDTWESRTRNKEEKVNIKNNLIATGKILGIMGEDPDVWLGYNQSSNPEKEEIEGLINQRNEARRDKDFKLADEIRDKLKIKGIEIEDTKNGTIWRKDS